jgi:hypothetical protein
MSAFDKADITVSRVLTLTLRSSLPAIASLLLLGTSAASAQGDRSLYFPTTIRTILDGELAPALADDIPNASVAVGAGSREGKAALVRAVYTGAHRPVSREKTEILDQYVRSYLPDRRRVSVAGEYLFREGGQDYWLIVQPGAADTMTTQLQPGDTVNLFVSWLGYSFPRGVGHPSVGGTRPITWAIIVDFFDR